MTALKGSQTEKNLLIAFAGESQARERYNLFAKQAKKENLEYLMTIFDETASHEYAHARRLFGFLEGGDVEITASYPAGKVGTSLENLKAAKAGEHHEAFEMYPGMADVAESEGFKEIAQAMRNIAHAEEYHENRYNEFIERLESNMMFRNETPIEWRCLECGYHLTGTVAPKQCPACAASQDHYQKLPLL